MKIGDLNKDITLQYKTLAPDTYGSMTTTWVDQATIKASIEPIRGIEFLKGQQIQSEITHRIRIRFRNNLRPDFRVKYGDRYFSLVSPPINPKEKNRFLELMCKELFGQAAL